MVVHGGGSDHGGARPPPREGSYAVTANGVAYALNARTGRQLWQATSFTRFGKREYFYATPAVGYGRVFAPNTDGTVYAFGARSGDLLWARSVGTYVYTAPALWRRKVYVGTWDGNFIALDAATGEIRWRYDASVGDRRSPDRPLRPRLLLHLRTMRARRAASGQDSDGRRTFALDARNGQLVWSFFDGKYSPLVADPKRIYIIGPAHALRADPTRSLAEAQAATRRCEAARR